MKGIICSLVFVLLVGCATHPQKHNNEEFMHEHVEVQHPIYGKLEQKNDRYVFSEFSETYIKTEPWIRLTDMQPMWDTNKESCFFDITKQLGNCKTVNEKLFRFTKTDFTVKSTAGYVALSALTLGVFAALPPGAVEFDQEKYQSAVKDAISNLIDTYKSQGQNYAMHLMEYDSEVQNFNNTYEKVVRSYPSPVPRINLRDKSGLFGSDTSDFKSSIYVGKNSIPLKNDTDYMDANTIDNLIFLVKKRNALTLSELQKAISTVSIRCNTSMKNVNYTVTCPETLSSSSNEFNVDIVVNSVSYENVLPEYINEEDNYINLIFKDGTFHVINKTNSYITVDSLSFYYNEKIATSSKLGRELAPSSETILLSINSLPIDKNAIAFPHLTQTIALKTKINYGVALKYKVIDANKENTLFRLHKYQLSSLL